MRRAILGGSVAVLLVIASAAMAGAQQRSQDGDLDGHPASHDGMHEWMADHWDEMPEMADWDQMPMNGGSGHLEDDGWLRLHDDMRRWMADDWDDKPMHGGDPANRLDPHGDGEVGPCHGADLGPDRDVRVG